MARQYADDAFIIGYRFSPEEMEVPGIRFDDTMYLLEKLAARGVDYLHFSVGATLRPSIVDTSDPTPLIEKYCAMRSDTLAQVPVMGVGGVVNAADAEQGLDHGYGPDCGRPRLHRLSGLGVTYRRRRRAGAVYRQHPA